MNRWIKRILLAVIGLLVLLFIAGGLFFYRIKGGFASYEDTPPELSLNEAAFTVLVFSKTNGFPHSGAIEESKKAFQKMADKNGWSLIVTENGATFNDEYLPNFDVVIWNNATGPNLNEEQRASFRKYMENGGRFMGIHGAGDASHKWPWYEKTLIGADFTHHSMNPQFQEATMNKECTDAFTGCAELPQPWIRSEEWYVFLNNPREHGAKVIYTVDENTFDPNGNIGWFVDDKDFGMGEDHPIVWYKCLDGGGRAFYSALGHSGEAFKEAEYLDLLEKAIIWLGDETSVCE